MRSSAQHGLTLSQHAKTLRRLLTGQRRPRADNILEQRAVMAFAEQSIEDLESFLVSSKAVPTAWFQ
jgi:hypothetical protein